MVQRNVELDSERLYDVVGDMMYENPIVVARQLFAIPVADLLDQLGEDADVTTVQILVKGNRVRMGSEDGYMLMDLDTGTVQMVDGPGRSYFEYTREMIEGAEAAANAQLEAMGIDPDEEYEMDSQFDMDDPFVDDNGDPMGEVIGTGVTRKIGGMTATSVETAGWESVSVSWCADENEMLVDAFAKLVERTAFMAEDDEEEGDDDECPEGIPVLSQRYSPDMMTYSVEEVVSVSFESLDDGLFVIPDGFRKKDSPF